jgi:hypothetical protein
VETEQQSNDNPIALTVPRFGNTTSPINLKPSFKDEKNMAMSALNVEMNFLSNQANVNNSGVRSHESIRF